MNNNPTQEYLMLLHKIQDPLLTAKVYQMIHYPFLFIGQNNQPESKGSKKQELQESLRYLQEKKIKTPQDKLSMDTITKVLQNM
jgi:D-arabinose 1-dehydrogenase-like Zn-dependent alcohol dehydrogenase